jgi:hypothetical protein
MDELTASTTSDSSHPAFRKRHTDRRLHTPHRRDFGKALRPSASGRHGSRSPVGTLQIRTCPADVIRLLAASRKHPANAQRILPLLSILPQSLPAAVVLPQQPAVTEAATRSGAHRDAQIAWPSIRLDRDIHQHRCTCVILTCMSSRACGITAGRK